MKPSPTATASGGTSSAGSGSPETDVRSPGAWPARSQGKCSRGHGSNDGSGSGSRSGSRSSDSDGGSDRSRSGGGGRSRTARRWRQIAAHRDTAPLLLGLLVGLGVCWPMLGGRPLFLLDWVAGPHPAWPSTAMLGLDGGLTAGVVGGVVMTLLVRSIGEAVTWLVLLVFFPLAAVGAGRLAGGWRSGQVTGGWRSGQVAGGWCWGRVAAATLYCVNPWVFNRIYAGQLALLIGYALLPFAVASALRATGSWAARREARPGSPGCEGAAEAGPGERDTAGAAAAAIGPGRPPTAGVDEPGRRWSGRLGPVLWWAALTAIAPHYVWIYGLVLVAVVVVTRPWSWRLVAWLATSAAAMVVLSLYILLPHTATELPTRVGTVSLDIYRTSADPHLGLLPNVAALYGFWRLGPGPVLPKDVVTGWPWLMAAMLVVIVAGYLAVLRHPLPRRAATGGSPSSGAAGGDGLAGDGSLRSGAAGKDGLAGDASLRSGAAGGDLRWAEARRRLGWVLLVSGVAGYFLALGSQGPTGALFRWAYDTVPFFAIMREPQKFLMLTALAYAVGLGWGVERLAGSTRPVRLERSWEQAPGPEGLARLEGSQRADHSAGPDAPRVDSSQPADRSADVDGSGDVDSSQRADRAADVDGSGDVDSSQPADRSAGLDSAQHLGGSRRRGTWAVAAAIGLVLPLAYTPTIFDGLAGQIAPSTIPAAYHQADQLMGDGPGRVLYLPWHLYESQPFTGDRVVATVGPSFFRRSVIAGQNVQVGSVQTQSTSLRGAYLTHLYRSAPGITDFGADVAALGVKYVVLAKTVDWRSDLWLEHQSDLRLVLDDASLLVWQNLAYHGPGRRSGTTRPVRQLSPVAYQIPPGAPGVVDIDAAYQKGWQLDGHEGRPSAEGTVEFVVGHAGGIAQFRPWGLVKLGDALSGGGFAILAVLVSWDIWRRRTQGTGTR